MKKLLRGMRTTGVYVLLAAIGGFVLPAGCPLLFPTDNANQNANDNGSTNENANENENTNDNGATGDSGLTGKFVGAETCSLCHRTTHRNWSETLHARALDTLEEIGQGENATCLPCHTVGFGESGGFVDRATTNALAGVGCESCHGPGKDHVDNIEDASLRPVVDISADVCGKCHTGEHHPNFEDWQESGHAGVAEHVAEGLAEGSRVNACGQCHSGTAHYYISILNEPIEDNFLEGTPVEDLLGIQCANCHDPHMRTGNAPEAEDGRDYQLRWPEVAEPFPTNTVDAATDPTRFNICGQCHHSRGRDWTSTSRGPHHSVQSNVYIGEMPIGETDEFGNAADPLVPSLASVHLRATEQCATCHLYREDFMDEQAPAISGHTFETNFEGCVASGCHSSQFEIETRAATFMASIDQRIADIKARLGDESTWQYSATGGPSDQSTISDNVKKIRFLISYIESDGSGGIHNPDYVKSMLDEAEELLDDEGL